MKKKRLLILVLAGTLLVGCGNEVSSEISSTDSEINEIIDEQESYIELFLQGNYCAYLNEDLQVPESEIYKNNLYYEGSLAELKNEFIQEYSGSNTVLEYKIFDYNDGTRALLLNIWDEKNLNGTKAIYMLETSEALDIVFECDTEYCNADFYNNGIIELQSCGEEATLVTEDYYLDSCGILSKLAVLEQTPLNVEGDTTENWSSNKLTVNGTDYGFIDCDDEQLYDEKLFADFEEKYCQNITIISQDQVDSLIDDYAKTLGCEYVKSKEATTKFDEIRIELAEEDLSTETVETTRNLPTVINIDGQENNFAEFFGANAKYLFMDVTGDGTEEIAVKTEENLYIIDTTTNFVIYTGDVKEIPVNSDEIVGILYVNNEEAGQIEYEFKEVNAQGEVTYSDEFSWYDGNEDGQMDANDYFYYKGDEMVEKDFWLEVYNPFVEYAQEELDWNDVD